MLFKRMIAMACTAVLAISSVSYSVSAQEPEMRDITTMELVRDMGVGINLGNTLESCGSWIAQWGDGTPRAYETAWGSPVITKEMIQGYANEGFGVLRIPVAWSNMMSDDYTISDAYLKRVQEVTNWAMDAGLYVILNIHYDGGWFNDYANTGMSFSVNYDTCMKKYTRVWEQLTDAFASYDDHLMFESLNEEGCWEDIWNRWGGDNEKKKDAYTILNEINQKFVDIVRSSGGNNPKRHLLIAGYATDVDLTCDALFQMPNDPMNRCAVSVHYYTPSDFAILEEDASWATARSTWGTDADIAQLNQNMEKLESTFIEKGIPVIIGEYGCPKKNKEEESVRLFLTSVCREAYERQICPVLWDITGLHYDRTTCQMCDPQLKAAFQEIVKKDTDSTVGDVNLDGVVLISDVVMLQKYLLAAETLTKEQAQNADVLADGALDAFDLAALRSMQLSN